MTASPPPPVSPLLHALINVREIRERARRTGDRREIETAVEAVAERTATLILSRQIGVEVQAKLPRAHASDQALRTKADAAQLNAHRQSGASPLRSVVVLREVGLEPIDG